MNKFHNVKREKEKEGRNKKDGTIGILEVRVVEVDKVESAEKSAFTPRPRDIGLNEAGRPVGESHHNAILSDHEVDLVLSLREEGYSFAWIAKKMEVSKGHIWRICTGRQRSHLVVAWKRRKPSP